MEKCKLIQLYREFVSLNQLDPKDVIVGAGGSMVMLGLRGETNDIDITTSSEIFNRFKDAGYPASIYPATGSNSAIEFVKATEFIDLHTHSDREVITEMEDGVCFESAETVLAFKQALNRPKDQADIKALIKYINLKKFNSILPVNPHS